MITKEQREELRHALADGATEVCLLGNGFKFSDGLFVDEDTMIPTLLDALDEMELQRNEILAQLHALFIAGKEAREDAKKCLVTYGEDA